MTAVVVWRATAAVLRDALDVVESRRSRATVRTAIEDVARWFDGHDVTERAADIAGSIRDG